MASPKHGAHKARTQTSPQSKLALWWPGLNITFLTLGGVVIFFVLPDRANQFWQTVTPVLMYLCGLGSGAAFQKFKAGAK
jgi:hypothetical protein